MTRPSTPRRTVHYNSLAELLSDAERQAAQGAAGRGTWSPGQIFEHLAVIMERSIDGFSFRASLPVRLFAGTFLKRRLMQVGVPAGYRLRGAAARELVPPAIDTAAGLAHLRTAVERCQRQSCGQLHPFLGRLTHEEWLQIHLRHAELHMSFLGEDRLPSMASAD